MLLYSAYTICRPSISYLHPHIGNLIEKKTCKTKLTNQTKQTNEKQPKIKANERTNKKTYAEQRAERKHKDKKEMW